MTIAWPDLINAGWEIVGGAVLWLNVLATYRAKRVVGVSVASVLFFVGWDVWFLCFYWQLAQWASLMAGLWLTSAQATWLGQMIYYRRQRERSLNAIREAMVTIGAPCPCFPAGNPGNCPTHGCPG